MASRSTDILREYASHIAEICPSLPTAETLVSQLRSPLTGFGYHCITFPLFCTGGRGSEAPELCQIFQELHLWNELLSHARVELREVTPGRLAVARINQLRLVPINHQALQRAVICLHWLLTMHHCVFSLEPDSLVLKHHIELFCDSVQHARSVTVLRLCGQVNYITTIPKLFDAIVRTGNLEELHFDAVCLSTDEVQSMLLAYIKNSAVLRTLTVNRFCPKFKTRTVVEALTANSTITTLKIQLEDADTRAFASFLANNNSLTELGLVGQKDSGLLTPVFQALEGNHTLVKLSLHQFELDVLDSVHLADMLTVNTAIEDISFSSCTWTNFPPDWLYESNEMQEKLQAAKARWESWWQVDTFADGIKNSVSLKRLQFDKNHFQYEEMLRLLNAVGEASRFQELCFENISCQSIDKIAVAVLLTGTMGKFVATECRSSCCYFSNSINKLRSFPSETVYSFYDLMPPQLGHMCAALANRDQVSALDLHMKELGVFIDKERAGLLGAYLASTRALRTLRMRLEATKEAWPIIIRGLCNNKSLEELSLGSAFLEYPSIQDICAWLQKSRTLYHFTYKCGFYDHGKEALVQQLVQSLENNYTLTFLRVDYYIKNDDNWQLINHVLSRNNSFVTRAVEFALGSTLKLVAAAFELVYWHPLLRRKVEQAYSVNAAEAQEKVLNSIRRLQADFWKLSGVVNEELSCYSSNERRTQIDSLGTDAWYEIRKFLSLSDVTDN